MFGPVHSKVREAKQVGRPMMSKRCAKWNGRMDGCTQPVKSYVVENYVGSRCGLLCEAPLVEFEPDREENERKSPGRPGVPCVPDGGVAAPSRR
jgi:hypothetical protein